MPQDGVTGESERRDRRQQVQGGELARQQLHEKKDGAAPTATTAAVEAAAASTNKAMLAAQAVSVVEGEADELIVSDGRVTGVRPAWAMGASFPRAQSSSPQALSFAA